MKINAMLASITKRSNLKFLNFKDTFHNKIRFNFGLAQNNLFRFRKQTATITHNNFSKKQIYLFSKQEKKDPFKVEDVPKQNLQIVQTQEQVQNQQVEVFHAKGTLSILDKVPGIKANQSGQLYVLMFTCGQCNYKQIRSFTKNAYHNGVVLVRCQGCQKVHLVADNLGWFQDNPVNVQTLHKGKVQKVHDQGAISMFLQKAFGQQKQLLSKIHEHDHEHKGGCCGGKNNQNEKMKQNGGCCGGRKDTQSDKKSKQGCCNKEDNQKVKANNVSGKGCCNQENKESAKDNNESGNDCCGNGCCK